MEITAKRIYCFMDKYEPQITSAFGATVSLCLMRLYFNNKDTGSESFGQLTEKEEKKLKESNRRISQALKLSKFNVGKLRGGGSPPINTKLIARKFATIAVNAAKDGSIHALALIITFKIYPKSEKFIKTICLGGNTDALINEIAKNLQTKKRIIITRLLMDKKIRSHVNNILLDLELIKEPLGQLDLVRLAISGISAFEIPFVKGAILATRGITIMYLTNKLKQVVFSQFGREIAEYMIVIMFNALSDSEVRNICDMTKIEKLKQGLASAQTLREIVATESSVATNILNPMFNEEIIDFIEINPVVEKLIGSQLFKNPLIHYSPKFNVDYVIERLVIGNDISKLPRDHITNLW